MVRRSSNSIRCENISHDLVEAWNWLGQSVAEPTTELKLLESLQRHAAELSEPDQLKVQRKAWAVMNRKRAQRPYSEEEFGKVQDGVVERLVRKQKWRERNRKRQPRVFPVAEPEAADRDPPDARLRAKEIALNVFPVARTLGRLHYETFRRVREFIVVNGGKRHGRFRYASTMAKLRDGRVVAVGKGLVGEGEPSRATIRQVRAIYREAEAILRDMDF
jgi:hypothetical protein